MHQHANTDGETFTHGDTDAHNRDQTFTNINAGHTLANTGPDIDGDAWPSGRQLDRRPDWPRFAGIPLAAGLDPHGSTTSMSAMASAPCSC